MFGSFPSAAAGEKCVRSPVLSDVKLTELPQTYQEAQGVREPACTCASGGLQAVDRVRCTIIDIESRRLDVREQCDTLEMERRDAEDYAQQQRKIDGQRGKHEA